jgi:hypothetical protein
VTSMSPSFPGGKESGRFEHYPQIPATLLGAFVKRFLAIVLKTEVGPGRALARQTQPSQGPAFGHP